MKLARASDKSLVIEILTESFRDNKSVNSIVGKKKSIHRIKKLMAYSFDLCLLFGKVYLSDDEKACALVLFPETKKFKLKSIWLDIKLALDMIGISNIGKALSREAKIKAKHPTEKFAYLWFIGVVPQFQKLGVGKKLMTELIAEPNIESRPIYLETSTLTNISWYERFGFEVYDQLDLGYTLYFLRYRS